MGTFFNPFESQKGGGGGGGGDSSTYSVRKIVDSVTEQVSYRLTKTTNGSTIDVGEVIAFTGDEVLVDYDGQTILLNAAVENLKELAEQGKQEVTFSSLEIDTHNKTISQLSAELAAKNLEEGTIVTGRVYSEALPYNNYGNAEVLVNNSIFWWKTSSSTISPYSWNAIVVGNTVKMDWAPTYYQLPVASAQSLGGVKIGDNVQIAPDGTISVITTKGDTGTGIASIAKTSSSGLNDIYTITYTDSTTSTFTVTNGATITGGSIGQTGHLILTMSDGRTIDAGALPTDNEVEVTTTSSQPADPNVELWVDLSTQQTLDIPEINDSSTSSTQDTWSCKKIYDEQQRQEEEIGVVANAGAKNLFKNTAVSKTYLGVTFTVNEDGTVSLSGAATTAAGVLEIGTVTLPAGSYIVSGCPAGGSWAPNPNKYRIRIAKNGAWLGDETGTGYTVTVNGSDVISLQINSGIGFDTAGLVFKPMIRPVTITDSTYEPYALSNPVLTPALIDQVDEGAKNKLHYDGISTPSGDTANISFSCCGDLITITGSTSSNAAWCYLTLSGSIITVNDFCNGKYFLSSERTGSGAANVFAYESSVGQFADDSGNGTVIPNKSTSNTVRIMVNIPKGATVNITLKIMICTIADRAISPAVVPYRPSWQEMWEMIQELQSRIHGETVDLLTEPYASHLYNKYFDDNTGQVDDTARPSRVLCDLFIDIPDDRSSYTVQAAVSGSAGQFICYFYDANENFLPSQTSTSWVDSSTFKTIPNAKKLRVLMRLSSNADIAIGNISTLKVLFR